MTETTVTYMCWSCGSIVTKREETDSRLPLAAIEQWNICPDCMDKKENSTPANTSNHNHPGKT